MKSIYYQGKYNLPIKKDGSLFLPIAFLGALSSRSDKRELYLVGQDNTHMVNVYDSQEIAKQRIMNFVKIKLYSRGRIIVPDEIMQRVSFDGLVSVVGNLTHFEIWNPANYISRPDNSPESIFSAFDKVHN